MSVRYRVMLQNTKGPDRPATGPPTTRSARPRAPSSAACSSRCRPSRSSSSVRFALRRRAGTRRARPFRGHDCAGSHHQSDAHVLHRHPGPERELDGKREIMTHQPETVEPVDAAAEEEKRARRQEEAAEEADKFAVATEATAHGARRHSPPGTSRRQMVRTSSTTPPMRLTTSSRSSSRRTRRLQLAEYQSALTDALSDLTRPRRDRGPHRAPRCGAAGSVSASQPVDGVDAADRVMSQLVVAADPARAGGVTDPGVPSSPPN